MSNDTACRPRLQAPVPPSAQVADTCLPFPRAPAMRCPLLVRARQRSVRGHRLAAAVTPRALGNGVRPAGASGGAARQLPLALCGSIWDYCATASIPPICPGTRSRGATTAIDSRMSACHNLVYRWYFLILTEKVAVQDQAVPDIALAPSAKNSSIHK